MSTLKRWNGSTWEYINTGTVNTITVSAVGDYVTIADFELIMGNSVSALVGGEPVKTEFPSYAKRIDFYSSDPVTGDIIYKGDAQIGSTNDLNVWRIVRLTILADGDVLEEYANGNGNFINIWNDRLTYTYS
jgi:hypothetical protein